MPNMNVLDVDRFVTVENTFMAFMHVSNQRLERMERMIDQIVTTLRTHRPRVAPNAPNAHDVEPVTVNFEGLPDVWYTMKRMPNIRVTLPIVGPYGANGITKARVELETCSGANITHILTTHVNKYVDVVNNVVTLPHLVFNMVSSKNGGTFNLKLLCYSSCPDETIPIAVFISTPFRIMSGSLHNRGKIHMNRVLREHDMLCKMPGIGKIYARRLTHFGIHTVGDLASLICDDEKVKTIIMDVRNTRGSLTEAKFRELIQTAHTISRHQSNDLDDLGDLSDLDDNVIILPDENNNLVPISLK